MFLASHVGCRDKCPGLNVNLNNTKTVATEITRLPAEKSLLEKSHRNENNNLSVPLVVFSVGPPGTRVHQGLTRFPERNLAPSSGDRRSPTSQKPGCDSVLPAQLSQPEEAQLEPACGL